MYKIFHVSTGRTLKAGFRSEDKAQDWLDAREDLNQELYVIDEMDPDEEDEWLAENEQEEDEVVVARDEVEDAEEVVVADDEDDLVYSSDDDDEDYDPDASMLSEIEPDDDI